jgi:formate hydrogenlyase subunit 4
VVVVLIVVGYLLWLINRFIPMAGSIKTRLSAVVDIAVGLWLLNVIGILCFLSSITVGSDRSQWLSGSR